MESDLGSDLQSDPNPLTPGFNSDSIFTSHATFANEGFIAVTPDEILSHQPRLLPQRQREFYLENGYLQLDALIPSDSVNELNTITAGFALRSRDVAVSDEIFDLAPGHTAESPKLRRIKRIDDRDDRYWNFSKGIVADVAADLLGPDVTFHHAHLNFKWHDGSDEVKWHQDAQVHPHTNYNVLTICAYLADVAMENGPIAVVSKSHDGPLFDPYDESGDWVGCLPPNDIESLDRTMIRYLSGPAGTLTVHNCRTVHGSPSSAAAGIRPVLLNAYASADAFAYMPHPGPSSHYREIVRGEAARWAHHDPRPCPIPPDWSQGYGSIYAHQSGERAEEPATTSDHDPHLD